MRVVLSMSLFVVAVSSGCTGSRTEETPAPPPAASGELLAEPAGIDVRLRWAGPAQDPVVPGIEQVPECASDGPAGRLVVGADRGIAGVVVTVSGAPGVPEAPAPATLVAAGCRFAPASSVVAPATPLLFENRDSVLHTFHLWTAAEREPKNVQNIAVPPGGRPARFVLKDVGRYRVTSDRFEHMEAWIVVAPSGTGGVTDGDGRLSLGDVPPGEYAVRVFHPEAGEATRSVVVPPDGPAALHVELGGSP